MRFKSVLMLASIAMILVAMGTGNAFAAKVWYSGTERSQLNSGNSPEWLGTITQDVSAARGDTLAWNNRWYNNNPGSTVTPWAQYGGSPPGGASGGWYTAPSSISYGYYYPSSTGNQEIDSTVLDTASGSYDLGVNHLYQNGQTLYGTGYTWGMGFTV